MTLFTALRTGFTSAKRYLSDLAMVIARRDAYFKA
jgi:hypothetical protein